MLCDDLEGYEVGAMGRRLERDGIYIYLELTPSGASDKELTYQCRRHKRHGFSLWVRKIPWRRARQPTPVFFFLPHPSITAWRIAWTEKPTGYSPWGRTQLRQLSTHTELIHVVTQQKLTHHCKATILQLKNKQKKKKKKNIETPKKTSA